MTNLQKFHLQFGLRVESPSAKNVCSTYITQQRLLKKIKLLLTDDYVQGFSCGSPVKNIQQMYHSLESRIINMEKNDLEFSYLVLEEEGIKEAVRYIRSVIVTS